jgi:hypothetical protein
MSSPLIISSSYRLDLFSIARLLSQGRLSQYNLKISNYRHIRSSGKENND